MPCPDCERYRQMGKSFCGSCGRKLTDDSEDTGPRITSLICPDCERFRAEGARYCGTCGSYLMPAEQRERPRDDMRLLKPCVIFAVLLALLEVAFVWISVPYVFTTEGLTIELLYLTPEPMLLAELRGIPMCVWYLALSLIITFCMVLCGKRYVEARGRMEEPVNTALVNVPVLLGMCIAVEYVIIILTELASGSVDVDPSMYDKSMIPPLVNASVWEEIMSRVCLIGLPMLVLMLIVNRGQLDMPWYRYLMGGFGYSRIAFLLVVFSSVFFGCAHLNWGLWKILPAVIAGLCFGYVYMKYGLYASIVMHAMNDLVLLPLLNGFALSGLLSMAMVVLALPGFIVYGRRLREAYRNSEL